MLTNGQWAAAAAPASLARFICSASTQDEYHLMNEKRSNQAAGGEAIASAGYQNGGPIRVPRFTHAPPGQVSSAAKLRGAHKAGQCHAGHEPQEHAMVGSADGLVDPRAIVVVA